ncbi:MAG: hypothetical protein QM691_09655 [Opitutaceae bacterium]
MFLAPHAHVFRMAEKRRQREADAGGNPFLDPAGYREWVARSEAAFTAQLPR